MEFFLCVSGLLALVVHFAGGALAVVGLRNAPEGYEDESGFHAVEARWQRECDEVSRLGTTPYCRF